MCRPSMPPWRRTGHKDACSFRQTLYTSPEAQQNATQLVQAGVQIRTLTTPIMYAKLVVTARQTWARSQNWSAPAMQNNREVGVITRNASVHTQALRWFNGLWPLAPGAAVIWSVSIMTRSVSGHRGHGKRMEDNPPSHPKHLKGVDMIWPNLSPY